MKKKGRMMANLSPILKISFTPKGKKPGKIKGRVNRILSREPFKRINNRRQYRYKASITPKSILIATGSELLLNRVKNPEFTFSHENLLKSGMWILSEIKKR